MQAILYISAGIAIGATLLSIIKLLADYKEVLTAKILMFALLGAICYVLGHVVPESSDLYLVLLSLSSTVSPLFWIFTLSFFQTKEEPFHLAPIHYVFFTVSVSLGLTVCFKIAYGEMVELDFLVLLNFMVKTSLVCAGIYVVCKNWKNDLMQCRRNLRLGIVLATGLLVLFALTTELIFSGSKIPEVVNVLTISVIALISLFQAYWLLISNPEGFILAIESIDGKRQTESSSDTHVDITDEGWLEKLSICMEDESYYKNTDLTIRTLSSHIGVPEHHLRRLINQHLGYRNFNDYLNRFRIKEASQRLLDPKQNRLPITTIAIESGYTSLTTFNKAFKLINEMTPREFRKAALD